MSKNPSLKKETDLVIAFDIGTTRSGYSFVFAKDLKKSIYMSNSWPESPHKYAKTLSHILYDGNKPVAFGYEALKKYHDLESADLVMQHSLFKEFKIGFKANPKGSTMCVHGRRSQTYEVLMAHMLGYLYSQAKKVIDAQSIKQSAVYNVQWVLSVPSEWEESHMHVMKKAAVTAGLISHDAVEDEVFLFVREPECAVAYCLELYKLVGNVPIGTKFLTVDAGGGTVDMATHILSDHGVLKESSIRSGEMLGSVVLDNNFLKQCETYFGTEVMNEFKSTFPKEFLGLQAEWEFTKLMITDLNSVRNVTASGELVDLINQKCQTVDANFFNKNKKHNNKITLRNDVLKLIYQDTIDSICTLVENQLAAIGSVDYMFVVGGFGQCAILQEALKAKFVGTSGNCAKAMFCPQYCGDAVLQGEALLGLNPSLVKIRKAKLYYGISIDEPSTDENQYPDKINFKYNAQKDDFMWHNRFKVFVEKGQDLPDDYIVKHEFTAAKGQAEVVINIYTTPFSKVFCTDDATKLRKIGSLTLTFDDPTVEKDITVEFKFGQVLMTAETKASTGEPVIKTDLKL